MTRFGIVPALLAIVLAGGAGSLQDGGQATPTYDIVIRGGRVMDPESGLDAIRNVAIQDGMIRQVSDRPLEGHRVIDATGLVVAPGFIDTDGYPENARLQVMDGVTSVLNLRRGTSQIDRWYAEHEGLLINYGVSVGYLAVRDEVMGEDSRRFPRRDPTEAEVSRVLAGVRRGLDAGAVALGMGDSGRPDPAGWELIEPFRLAAEARAHVVATLRDDLWSESNVTANLLQMLGAAAMSGATIHIPHLTSSAGPHTSRVLWTMARANEHGLRVTAEDYPYRAAISIADGRELADWSDEELGQLQPVGAAQRLTRQSVEPYLDREFETYFHNDALEPFVVEALQSPLVTVASHASDRQWTAAGVGHPRTSGTYSRVLGRYVREEGVLSLTDALAKMSLVQARRLESRVPEMRRKGRIREGADADIVVFDADRILDRATFQGQQPSQGMVHVLVNGTVVVDHGVIQESVVAGRPLRGRQLQPGERR